MKRKTVAGIIVYNPDLERLKRNLDHIFEQVREVFVLDNASDDFDRIHELLSLYGNIRLIRARRNVGVARGLNRIFEEGMKRGYQWVLTLDDDTVVDPDLVEKLSRAVEQVESACTEDTESNEKIGIVCAVPLDEKMQENVTSQPIFSQETYSLVKDCITAGSMTNIAAWQEIGGFDNRMFIDFVDIEFCTRLRENGYCILRVNDAFVRQRYGDISGRIRLPGFTLYRFNYPSQRIYYSVRNQVYYIRKHADFIDSGKQKLFLAGYIGKHLIFEKNRIHSCAAIITGMRDGMRMRLG